MIFFQKVEEQMVISIKKSIEDAYYEYPTIERTTWVQKWPGQSVLCVSQMYWTSEVHGVFLEKKPKQMRKYHEFLTVIICVFFFLNARVYTLRERNYDFRTN